MINSTTLSQEKEEGGFQLRILGRGIFASGEPGETMSSIGTPSLRDPWPVRPSASGKGCGGCGRERTDHLGLASQHLHPPDEGDMKDCMLAPCKGGKVGRAFLQRAVRYRCLLGRLEKHDAAPAAAGVNK